jgi:peptide/nickel transport system substrate-binding protein
VVSTSDIVEEQLVEEEKIEIQTTQQITQKITQTTEKQEGGGGCLIATAAFGSEITPQVQFLRGFRDNYVMSTIAGSSFMEIFNTWYYSFSPTVADFERQNSIFRDLVKYSIYPLIGILSISEFIHVTMYNSEIGLILAGFVASALLGIVYLWPIALIFKKIRQDRLSVKKPIFIIIFSIISLSLGIWTSNSFILQISTSLFVISTIIVSAMLFVNLIIYKIRLLI